MRPTCINHGCNSLVATMEGKVSDPNPKWRVHCNTCQKASYGGGKLSKGVTPFKTGCCSNKDGHLGWICYIDWKRVEKDGAEIVTAVDHKNGNPTDNRLINLQELCEPCHREKSRRNGDHNSWR